MGTGRGLKIRVKGEAVSDFRLKVEQRASLSTSLALRYRISAARYV